MYSCAWARPEKAVRNCELRRDWGNAGGPALSQCPSESFGGVSEASFGTSQTGRWALTGGVAGSEQTRVTRGPWLLATVCNIRGTRGTRYNS